MVNIIGQGLAGSCLAWQAYWKGLNFTLYDLAQPESSSLVAAGLINPVTGANFNKSWEIDRFLNGTRDFFLAVEKILDCQIWYDLEIVRILNPGKQRDKVLRKWDGGELSPYADRLIELNKDHWKKTEGLLLKSGARVDTRLFVERTKSFFLKRGRFFEIDTETVTELDGQKIFARGASGLIKGDLSPLKHRCAKGEILTVKIAGLDEKRAVIDGGWLIPLGNNLYRVGATYEWNELNLKQTVQGVKFVEKWLSEHLSLPFEIVDHDAGIRPIVRTSIPLLKKRRDEDWVINGLGSKGSLYAPALAEVCVACIMNDKSIPEEFDADVFARQTT